MPGHRSQLQYDTQVDSQSEDNRKYCKEEATWSQYDREDARKHREGETSVDSEPRAVCRKI